MVARDKYGRDIDVTESLMQDGNKDENSAIIAAIFGVSVFPNEKTIETGELKNEDMYVEVVYDIPEAMKRFEQAYSKVL